MTIEDLKKQYGRVFKYSKDGVDYIYRPLCMGEYHHLSRIEDVAEMELKTLQYGIVSHKIKTMNDIPSGVAESLVLLISKVTNISLEVILAKVQQYRDEMGMADDYIRWKSQLIKCLNYTPEQIDSMSVDEFAKNLVMAEEVVGMPFVTMGESAPQEGSVEKSAGNEASPGPLGPQADKTVDPLRKTYLQGKNRRFKRS